jgi:hypothetical protein
MRHHFAALSALLLTGLAAQSEAHSFYTGLSNGSGQLCCGGSDCGPLNPVLFRHGVDGTIEVWHAGAWYQVADEEILRLPSPDGRIHMCFWGSRPRYLVLPGGM